MESNGHLRNGSLLMAIAGVAFVGYGVVFLIWDLAGAGFELGVETVGGFTRAELSASHPEILHYISHLHIATAAFIIATGVAVAGLAWFGVRQGHLWAWTTAVIPPVVGLALALPMHWIDRFGHDWLTHLGPIYIATIVFVVGALLAAQGLRTSRDRSAGNARVGPAARGDRSQTAR